MTVQASAVAGLHSVPANGPSGKKRLITTAVLALKLASGLFNLMRNLGGAIGIAICATILNDRTNFHFMRLSEHLNTSNESMNDLLAGAGLRILSQSGDALMARGGALRQLWELTLREAQIQTFSDTYIFIFFAFVITTAMVPLMLKVGPPKEPSADAH
jgi:DHA2 family multidrug resistance protein